MAGINRALKHYQHLTESRSNIGIKCIFLSHQQKDKDVCRKIADYLTAADIDVYFDEDDEDLKFYRQTNRPEGVVESIRTGIKNSSHMLVVVSPNTMYSTWVPWEVGYGFDHISLGVLTLKGITNDGLPDYLKTAPILVRGTKSLNSYLSRIAGKDQLVMERAELIKTYSMSAHPLDNYLDWNQ